MKFHFYEQLVQQKVHFIGRKLLSMPLTCSGVAVMGLGMWETGVAEAGVRVGVRVGVGVGLGLPAAGEAGARYLIMAGSTSGVTWKKKIYPQGRCCVNIHTC